MSKYKIADILVEMSPRYPRLLNQSERYRVDTQEKEDFTIFLSDEFLTEKHSKNPHLPIEDCEYVWAGSEFYHKILEYDGIMLHSSCVAVDGKAYLFSAPSGTGKSTHTALWQKKFGDDLVFVNDDKPALRFFDGKVYACGTPFSGKTDLNTNQKFPLAGICLLHRAETNFINEADKALALKKIFTQILRPKEQSAMLNTLDILNKILSVVPVYDLYCNMDDSAADISYAYMSTNSTI